MASASTRSAGGPVTLDVLAKLGQELHQALDREQPRPVAHQTRDVRLLDAEDLAGHGLREAARLDDPVDLQRQARPEQLLLRVGQGEVGEYVPAPLLRPDRLALLHGQFCLSLSCFRAAARRCSISSMSFRGVAIPFFDFFWNA
jgi:hypothetical protein